MSVIKLRPNLLTTCIEIWKHFGRRDSETTEMAVAIEP